MWVYSIFSDALNKRRNKIHVSTLRELMYGTRFILTKITAMLTNIEWIVDIKMNFNLMRHLWVLTISK